MGSNRNADAVRSDFLFARPSFLEGVGRIVDISGSLNTYNESRSNEDADARAIRQDWEAVGHDVGVALEQVRAESAE